VYRLFAFFHTNCFFFLITAFLFILSLCQSSSLLSFLCIGSFYCQCSLTSLLLLLLCMLKLQLHTLLHNFLFFLSTFFITFLIKCRTILFSLHLSSLYPFCMFLILFHLCHDSLEFVFLLIFFSIQSAFQIVLSFFSLLFSISLSHVCELHCNHSQCTKKKNLKTSSIIHGQINQNFISS